MTRKWPLVFTAFVFLMLSILGGSMVRADTGVVRPEQVLGSWTNVKEDPSGLTALRIFKEDGTYYLDAWGSCHPYDCHWGKSELTLFGQSAGSGTDRFSRGLVEWNPGFASKSLILELGSNRITYQIYTEFTDDSGRSNFVKSGQMKRVPGNRRSKSSIGARVGEYLEQEFTADTLQRRLAGQSSESSDRFMPLIEVRYTGDHYVAMVGTPADEGVETLYLLVEPRTGEVLNRTWVSHAAPWTPGTDRVEQRLLRSGGTQEPVSDQRFDLSVKVNLDGERKQPRRLDLSANPECGKGVVKAMDVLRNQNGTLRNVVVRLDGPANVPGDTNATVVMDQENCFFKPKVIVARPGQPVEFQDSDPNMHNVRGVGENQHGVFNRATYQGDSFTETLEQPGLYSIRCDVHPWMQGWIWVTDDRPAAVTRENGQVSFQDIPAGEYEINLWHEEYGTRSNTVHFSGDQDETISLEYLTDEETDCQQKLATAKNDLVTVQTAYAQCTMDKEPGDCDQLNQEPYGNYLPDDLIRNYEIVTNQGDLQEVRTDDIGCRSWNTNHNTGLGYNVETGRFYNY